MWLAIGAMIVCAACETTIAADLDAEQADRVLHALHAHQLAATKRATSQGASGRRFSVHVLDTDVASAVAVMRDSPRDGNGLAELVKTPSWVPTPTEEQARLSAAIASELETTLRVWDGIVSARVHITPAASRVDLLTPPPIAHAAVVIKHATGSAPASVTVRELVAKAVRGLRPEDVTVVLLEARKTQATPLTQLGPFAVARGSAPWLRVLIAVSLTLNALLAVWIATQRWRARSRQRSAAAGATDIDRT